MPLNLMTSEHTAWARNFSPCISDSNYLITEER